jgi:hypothetical protein
MSEQMTRKDFLRQEALLRAREVAQAHVVEVKTAADVVGVAEKFHAFLTAGD